MSTKKCSICCHLEANVVLLHIYLIHFVASYFVDCMSHLSQIDHLDHDQIRKKKWNRQLN